MKVIYTQYFDEYLEKIKDVSTAKHALKTVEKLESANSLHEITNIKAIKGYASFYRLRFSDFRIGFKLTGDNSILLLTIDHRSKIYRHFPQKYTNL